MKKLINSFNEFWIAIVITLLSTGTPFIAMGTDYYIDSSRLNDSGDGQSPATAWKRLTMASSVYLMPGDSLNLKNGSVWNGQSLYLYGSGSFLTGEWVYVKTYGTSPNKPKINNPPPLPDVSLVGWDAVDAIYNQSPYNQPARNGMNPKIGVYISGGDAWDISGINVTNAHFGIYGDAEFGCVGLYLHDLAFSFIKGIELQERPGFYVPCPNPQSPDCAYFKMWSPYPREPFSMAIKVTGVEYLNIRDVMITQSTGGIDCAATIGTVEDVFGDKILTGGLAMGNYSQSVTYKNCTILNAGWPSSQWAGIQDPIMWLGEGDNHVVNCDIGYCKNFGTGVDAAPIDFDAETQNCSIRYCFLHDNDYPAIENGMAGGPNHRVTIEGNVCYKNGIQTQDPAQPAFLLDVAYLTNPSSFSATINDNVIYKSIAGQALNYYFNNGYAWDFNYLETIIGYTVSNNQVFELGEYTLPLPVPDPYPLAEPNLALTATVSVSSGSGTAGAVKDGDRHTAWSSVGTGLPWVKLTWGTPQVVGKMRVNDDRNLGKWIQRGVLTFSDGSKINVTGGICNNGQTREVVFDEPKTITWVTFTAKAKAAGSNIGLAELQAYAPPPSEPVIPDPPAPGDTIVNFSTDRPVGAALLAGQYPTGPNGANWEDADFTTANGRLYFNFPRSPYTGSPTFVRRYFVLPEGKRFKSADIEGPYGATVIISQKGLYSIVASCTPTPDTYTVDPAYSPTSNIVSIDVYTSDVVGGSDVNNVMMDNFVWGD